MPQEMAPNNELALFDMKEVVLGRKLGKGGFSLVQEAVSFHPSEAQVATCNLSESQVAARADLADNAANWYHKQSRYAIKYLRPDLVGNPKKHRAAMKDLQRESRVLATLKHPNIIKLRGCAIPAESQHFLIIDRLDCTLNDRINEWKLEAKRFKATSLFCRPRRQHSLFDRLHVATEIASAIEFIHGKRMVYRDLKAGNIGFTTSGQVTLFDFGLCRYLPNESSAYPDGTYKMSGKVGTYRFMAPEVANACPYNELADVYSFSLLLYQILVLEKPYPTYLKKEHREKVIEGGERPPIVSQWPSKIQELLTKGWSSDISERPSMTEVLAVLEDVAVSMKENPANATVIKVTKIMGEAAIGMLLSGHDGTVKFGGTLDTVTSFESQESAEAAIFDAPPSPLLQR